MTAGEANLRASRITARLAAHSRAATFNSLPDEVIDRTKRIIADELGCMVLGSTLPPGQRMREFVTSVGGAAESTVIGGRLAPAGFAALVNGTASHADELDGVHSTQGHPAGTSVAGSLAIGEASGAAGQDFINAVVISFDVGCRVLAGLGGGQLLRVERHQHSSALYALGVAAAAGRLLDLDELRLQYAMALAMLNISVPAAFFGEHSHMSKAMNQGQSSYAGVTGALLAAHGIEAYEGVVERKDGLIDGLRTSHTDVSAMTEGFGQTFPILDAGFKYYSAGYPIHAPLYGALALMSDHHLAPEDIAKVRVGMPPASADLVDERQMPSICLQDMLSVGITLGRLGHEDASDASVVERADVRRLRGRIELVRDPDLGPRAVERRAAWVEIETTTGRRHRGAERIAPGHWEGGGMPWEDLREKFRSLVSPRLGASVSTRVLAVVEGLEALEDVRELGDLLTGERR